MLPPLPRRGGWAFVFAHSPNRISLPRYGCLVGPHIVLFEVCPAFTHVAACTLALPPIRDTLIEGFSHLVTLYGAFSVNHLFIVSFFVRSGVRFSAPIRSSA